MQEGPRQNKRCRLDYSAQFFADSDNEPITALLAATLYISNAPTLSKQLFAIGSPLKHRLHSLDSLEYILVCFVELSILLASLQRLGQDQHAAGGPLREPCSSELLQYKRIIIRYRNPHDPHHQIGVDKPVSLRIFKRGTSGAQYSDSMKGRRLCLLSCCIEL